jgi:hypothetical protein
MDSNRQEKAFEMSFAGVYPHYVNKAIKKNRTEEEVKKIIYWLTGYKPIQFNKILENRTSFRNFFDEAPAFNPNAHKITGLICGYRVEEIENPLMQKIRYLDKLIDELAKGKAMEKILRS